MPSSPANRSIDAILFDMVGVLLFRDNAHTPVTSDQHNAEAIVGLYNHVDDRRLLADVREKLLLTDKEIGRALPHIPDGYEPFAELWEMLPALKGRYKLAVINNGHALAKVYWDAKFDFGGFDVFVSSAQEGLRKPHAGIFALTCQRLATEPKRCLFMDDLEENIAAAAALGMATIWWKNMRDGLAEFRRFLDAQQSGRKAPLQLAGEGLGWGQRRTTGGRLGVRQCQQTALPCSHSSRRPNGACRSRRKSCIGS